MDWSKTIVSYIPLIAGILTLFASWLIAVKNINFQKELKEREEIYKKLNDFYGPLLQLRLKSNLLYKQFTSKYIANGQHFRTLTYLLEGNKFHGNEEQLLKQIIEIGKDCEKLIQEKSGLIDDHNLRVNILPLATVHFLVLRLAYEGLLVGDANEYKDKTFPIELDMLLEKRKNELEQELKKLNKKNKPFFF